MGILRTDRVSGLGGANAIKGSTKFDGDLNYQGNYLSTEDSNDFNLGSGDFTIEAWIYASALSTNNYEAIIGQWPASGANANNSWVLEIVAGDLEFYYCHSGATLVGPIQGGSVKTNEWTHVMATRSGNTMYMFINGTAHNNSGQSVTHTFNDSTYDVTIGGYVATAAMWNGNISNVRVIKGTALHTSNFTVPTNELVKTSDTVLLACQSSADILKEATGKIITPRRNNVNSSYPTATKFTPNSPVGFSTTTDVGTQFGSTFDGVTTFDSQAYFVPPGGNTRERNRGRAVFGAGESPTADNVMEFINIQSGGRTIDFGDHSGNSPNGDAVSSSTRGVFTVHNSPANTNALEFITIANTGNSQDFGDQTSGGVSQEGAASNSTRGLFAGGIYPGSQVHDVTEFITIATLGNAIDFGNLIAAVTSNTGVADATRALFAGGIGPGSPFPTVNRIEFFTIASTGDATDFGDLTYSARYPGSMGDSTRGVFMGGATPSVTNIICFVTIQTTGNASDFGDLVTASADIAATSNSVRGIMGAGATPSITNTIEQLTIQTKGNASDFGDLSRVVGQLGVCSDSHGGIS